MFLGRDFLETLARRGRLGLVRGQEADAGRIRTGDRQIEINDSTQERIGDLHQDAGAVTGVRFGSDRATVVEVAQRGKALGDDVVAGFTGQCGNEGDATGIVLVGGVVETLCGRVCF